MNTSRKTLTTDVEDHRRTYAHRPLEPRELFQLLAEAAHLECYLAISGTDEIPSIESRQNGTAVWEMHNEVNGVYAYGASFEAEEEETGVPVDRYHVAPTFELTRIVDSSGNSAWDVLTFDARSARVDSGNNVRFTTTDGKHLYFKMYFRACIF